MIKHTLSKPSKSENVLTITVDEQFIAPYKQAVLKRLKANLKVAGFRPGKAPDKIAEREIGEAKVQAEVLEEVIMHAYSKAVREEKIETIASPQINLKKFVPYSELEFEAIVPVMPEIKLDYKKLKLKKQPVKIESSEIEETLQNMLKQSAKKTDSKEAIKKGDEVTFDFDGTRDGKAVDGASAKNHTLVIGEGSFIPGFEDEMVGLKIGASKKFKITFPKDYHAKELANKEVEFSIKINKVQTIKKPKADDAWAKTIGPVNNLKELKDEIKNSLVHNKQTEADKQYENELLEKVIDSSKLEVPESLINEQISRLRSETEQNLKNNGLDLEKYLQLQGQKPQEFEDTLKVEAKKRVQLGLILRYVIESEKIGVTDNEIQSELARLKTQYTDPKMQEELTHDHFISDLRNHLLTTKAIAKLVQYAQE